MVELNKPLAHQEQRIIELEDKLEQVINELQTLKIVVTNHLAEQQQQQQEEQARNIVEVEEEEEEAGDPRNTPLQVGDRVIIKNPKRGQPHVGHVTKIRKVYIFIDTGDGKEIRRSRKNIVKSNRQP